MVWVIAGQSHQPPTAAIAITSTDLDEEVVSEITDSVSFENTGRSHEDMQEDIEEDEGGDE